MIWEYGCAAVFPRRSVISQPNPAPREKLIRFAGEWRLPSTIALQLNVVGKRLSLRKLSWFGQLPDHPDMDQVFPAIFPANPGEDPENLRFVEFIQQSGPDKRLGSAMRDPIN